MTDCIKTGAYVYIENYNAYSPADLYRTFTPHGDRVIIVRLNPEHTWAFEPARSVTHRLKEFGKDSSYFWHKEAGIAVVNDDDLVEV